MLGFINLTNLTISFRVLLMYSFNRGQNHHDPTFNYFINWVPNITAKDNKL